MRMALIVATKVYGGTITSSPGPISIAFIAQARALVPLDVASTCGAPIRSPQTFSKRVTTPPSIRFHFRLRSVPSRLLSSGSPITGQDGKGFVLIGLPPRMAGLASSTTTVVPAGLLATSLAAFSATLPVIFDDIAPTIEVCRKRRRERLFFMNSPKL